jgi:hypothetical protein
MPDTSERVDRLEAALASFMERSESILADMRASNARTDAYLRDMQRKADLDREIAEKDRQQAEKDRKDFNKRLAELSDSMGTLVEDMVVPNARRIASEIFPNDPVLRIVQRLRAVHPADRGRMIEIDLLVTGKEHLMIVEAKRRLTPEKIREFAGKVAAVPDFLPEYSGYVLVPVVASVTIESSVIAFLNRQKVYGVAMGDETMELINLGQF